jgi:hypothetical protein
VDDGDPVDGEAALEERRELVVVFDQENAHGRR